MENEQKEKLAIIVGFAAIILVIIFTLVRGKFNSNLSNQNTPQNKSNSNNANVPTYNTISSKDLNKKLMGIGKQENLTLLDVRPFDAYISEHIIDSVNITPDEFPLKTKLDAHNLVVVIGVSALDDDINKAVKQLKDDDFSNTVVLAGGMSSWKEQVGLTVTYGDPKSFVDQSKVSYIDPENLNDALTQKVPVYIIDVRSADDYSKGHVNGAVNVPFDELEKNRGNITEKKVVVVGANELQEFQASVQMYDMLMVSPFVMRGAMPAWQTKNFAMVK